MIQKFIISLLFSLMSPVVSAETWDCKQLRDVLVGPPYYVDQGGESVGVTNGTETWDSVIGDQQRIMSKYLTSWEQWLASDHPSDLSLH